MELIFIYSFHILLLMFYSWKCVFPQSKRGKNCHHKEGIFLQAIFLYQRKLPKRDHLTSDFQFAFNFSLTKTVDCLASICATIIGAGFPNLQCTNTLVTKHSVTWVIHNDDFIFHPCYLGLQLEYIDREDRKLNIKFLFHSIMLISDVNKVDGLFSV